MDSERSDVEPGDPGAQEVGLRKGAQTEVVIRGEGARRSEPRTEAYAIPVSRRVSDPWDFDRPGVVRDLTLERMREELLPLLPAGFSWPRGLDRGSWEGQDGATLEVRCARDGRCAFLASRGALRGAAREAVARIAASPSWSVYDPVADGFFE